MQIHLSVMNRYYFGTYFTMKFERDRLNIFRAFTLSGSTGGRGGGDAKTIIHVSLNTSFGDIIIVSIKITHIHIPL